MHRHTHTHKTHADTIAHTLWRDLDTDGMEDTLRTQCVVSIYLYTHTYTLCVRETFLYDALLSRGMEVEIAWEDAERQEMLCGGRRSHIMPPIFKTRPLCRMPSPEHHRTHEYAQLPIHPPTSRTLTHQHTHTHPHTHTHR